MIQSHNAHEIKRVTIWYRWHPFYGQVVRMLRSRDKDGDQCQRCELPDGTTASIPAWMMGEPAISLSAMAQLRSLLDAWLRDHAIGVGDQTSVDSSTESESRWEVPE